MGKAAKRLREIEHSMTPQARKVKASLCSMTFLIQALKTVMMVLVYYSFSIGLTFYNQRFIKHFKYPLSMTMAHLVVKFMMSGVVRSILECCTGRPRTLLPWGMFIKRIGPAGLATAIDIGLSNWSFEFITVSLYVMTKSSSVIFILFFALIMKLEKWRWSLVVVVLFIATGLFMFTYHSTQFNMEGFAMVFFAAVLSGLRWTLSQKITQKNEIGLQNPVDMMYHMQPLMIMGLFPLSIGFEGVAISTTDQLFRYTDYSVLIHNVLYVLFGACLAFMLEFSEFLLLQQTSSLTLSISGIFKEICTLYLAHTVNGDQMNTVNAIGLVVCLVGITLHVTLKAMANREESLHGKIRHIEEVEMLTHNGTAASISDEEDDVEVFNAHTDR